MSPWVMTSTLSSGKIARTTPSTIHSRSTPASAAARATASSRSSRAVRRPHTAYPHPPPTIRARLSAPPPSTPASVHVLLGRRFGGRFLLVELLDLAKERLELRRFSAALRDGADVALTVDEKLRVG